MCNHYSQEVYQKMWDICLSHIPNIRNSRWILIFLGIPMLSLSGIGFGDVDINLETLMRFLRWYAPFSIVSMVAYLIADKNITKRQKRKKDQSVLIYWGNNIITLTLICILLQYSAYLSIQKSLELDRTGEIIALLLFFSVDLVIILISILNRKKILNVRIKNLHDQGGMQLQRPQVILVAFASFIAFAVIIFAFSGIQDSRAFLMFIISSITSLPMIVILMVGYYHLILMIEWRKQKFWKLKR